MDFRQGKFRLAACTIADVGKLAARQFEDVLRERRRELFSRDREFIVLFQIEAPRLKLVVLGVQAAVVCDLCAVAEDHLACAGHIDFSSLLAFFRLVDQLNPVQRQRAVDRHLRSVAERAARKGEVLERIFGRILALAESERLAGGNVERNVGIG